MNSKLITISSFLIFVTMILCLLISPIQSEATTSNQSFFDAENFTGPQGSINNSTSPAPVANTTNTTSLSTSTAPVANMTNHFAAQVFIHKNFTGNNTIITKNTPIIKDQFQDSISSLIITIDGNQSAENNGTGYMVEVCEHKSYAGNCMILGSGKHNVQTLGWLNDQISSIRSLSPQTMELKNIKPGIITNGSN